MIKNRKISGLIICGFFLVSIFLTGCGPEKLDKPVLQASNTIVGVWQTAGPRPWILTLAPDGKITDILRDDGLHFVVSQASLELRPSSDIYAKYVFGPCFWDYDPSSRILNVVLTVDDMVIQTDQQKLQCSFIDEFSGQLSEDGKVWTPKWILTTKFALPRPDQIDDNGIQTFNKTK